MSLVGMCFFFLIETKQYTGYPADIMESIFQGNILQTFSTCHTFSDL